MYIWDLVAIFFMAIGIITMFLIGYGVGFINGKRSSLPLDFFSKTTKAQSLSEIKRKAKNK
jgi:hypothetical protein